MKVFPERWGPRGCALAGFLLGVLIPVMIDNILGLNYLDPQTGPAVCFGFGLPGALLGWEAGIRRRRALRQFQCPKCGSKNIAIGGGKAKSFRRRPDKCNACGNEW